MVVSFGVAAPMLGFGVEACSSRYDACEFTKTCPGPASHRAGADFGGRPATASERGGFGGLATSDIAGEGGSGDSGPNETGQGGGGSGDAPSRMGEAGTAVDDGEGGAPTLPDTLPPEIVGVSPADAAVGVRADTDIVIAFSERMALPETERAFVSDDFSPSDLSFSWNVAGTTLTVHLAEPLAYRPIASPTPVIYHFSITDAACDRAGNHLTETHGYSFETAELAQTGLAPSDIRHIEHPVVGADEVVAYCSASMASIAAQTGVLFTFSLDELDHPEKLVELTQAELSIQYTQTGGLSADELRADSVSVVPFELTWDVPVLAGLGAFELVPGSNDTGAIQLDVRAAAADDFMQRDLRLSLAQFLVRDRDDASGYTANLTCNSALLLLTYAVSPN